MIVITAEQARALAAWVCTSAEIGSAALVQLRTDHPDSSLLVTQGDSYAKIAPDGALMEDC